MKYNKADAIMVLGRGIKPDGSLPNGPQLRGMLAVSLFKKGFADNVLLSSKYWAFQNFVPPITEAEAMKRFVTKLGVHESKIVKQEISEETIGEAFFNKINVVDKNGWKKLIVVTSEDHLERTKYIFKRVFGPEYELQFAATKSGLTKDLLERTEKLERKGLKFARNHLEKITPGNNEELKKMIFKKHLVYNNSWLKPIIKFVLKRQPYNF
ncbi:hypothetical protein COV18_02460 [Candidatus Woesearchaeota archaeon CG10_big_fil_rev_8_21_14_0_10_37_12]|nr:MAG: hypothetical protein COV18_02460 [Candidatus Woesearchaeota archaeon CG10_big_fil_rev_8_21_14_0_10_37_12]